MTRIVLVGNAYGCGLLVRGRLGTSRICAQDSRTTLAFDAYWNRMHSTLAWAFRALLRFVSVFLAIRTLLARAFVLGMIRLARIAESALTRIMTGCTALGTDAVRTRVRVSAVS